MPTFYQLALAALAARGDPVAYRAAVFKVVAHPSYTPNPLVRFLLKMVVSVGQAPIPANWQQRVADLLMNSSAHQRAWFLRQANRRVKEWRIWRHKL